MEKEEQYVHQVYEAIADHFSSTRYKPWPRVDKYIKDQTPGSVGCDVGGGNGKYLGYKHVYMIACDHSAELTRICAERIHSVSDDAARADALNLCYSPARLDFAISIAVVHHFATPQRRVAAIEALLRTVTPSGGTALVYVWALEQQHSRRGYNAMSDQDVLVPWVNNKDPSQVHERYYHLYREGELEEDIKAAGGLVLESGYERDNWWCVATPSSTTANACNSPSSIDRR